MTSPIRVGLIGLSGAPPDEYEGVSWTPNAHLPYLKKSPHYEIVALLNSSVESAKAAIERYELPPQTKAYCKPEDLAADKNVDLVVCSVRVDRHFQTVRPSIIAGKSIFVEWPLEKNLKIAKEMAELAEKHNSRTIVGAQGSFDPWIRKIREIIDSGRIGKVLSSNAQGALGNGGLTESKNVRYFLDREVGGNMVTIRWGHAIEFFAATLGEFKTWNSLLSNRLPQKDLVDYAKKQVVQKDAPNDVPDQIMIQGITTPLNVPVSIHFRGGNSFPGTPMLDWRIQGSKGEMRFTCSSESLNVGREESKLELFDAITGKIENIVLEKDEWDELRQEAKNIAREYEAFRKGEWYPDFKWAVKRHEMIEEMWRRYDLQQKGLGLA
ncbi:putative dehydrogenase [Halenospora varia]|nr:putative dehydrogenase [Halenospora varia]